MPSRRIHLTAATDDAISTDDIRHISGPSRVSLWASSVTKGDTIGLRLGKTVIMETDNCNIEASADVINVSNDQLVFGDIVGAGDLRVPIGSVTTELQFLLVVQPLQ